MSGVLTRAESRALRMTAENGECALLLTIPPSFSNENATSLYTKEPLNCQISVTKNSSHLSRDALTMPILDI